MSILDQAESLTVSFLNRVFGDDIFVQLKGEHNDLKDLLKKAEEVPPSMRAEMLERIEELLVPHSRGEEKTVYAVVHERLKNLAEQGRDAEEVVEEPLFQTNEAYEEHHAVDMLMSELKKTDVQSETWLAKLAVIKENLEHHIREEEDKFFAIAKDVLTTEEQQELLEIYLENKELYSETLPSQAQISARVPAEGAARYV